MNPLMNQMGAQNNMQSTMASIANIKRMLQGKDPDAVAMQLAQKNPQFAKFVQENKGKSPQQIAQEYGLDWDSLQSLLK